MNINPLAKRIMIYGDSLTFGKIPGELRYKSNIRFSGVIQSLLGNGYEIIEEGLRGRTISGENGYFRERNGESQFGPILASHFPLDLVLIFLGTNDANNHPRDIELNIPIALKNYVQKVSDWSKELGFDKPKIAFIIPPSINENNLYNFLKDIFKGSQGRILQIQNIIKKFASNNDIKYFDSSKVVEPSNKDGIHLDIESNQKLAESLSIFIKEII